MLILHRVSLSCRFQVDPIESQIQFPATIGGMYRFVCRPRRLDAGGQANDAGVEHRYRCRFVSDQTDSRLYCPCRGHHHRKVSPGDHQGTANVEGRCGIARRCT